MNPIIATLRGLILNPLLVAFARGILEAAAFAALLFAGEYVTSANIPDQLQMYAPIIVLVLRQLEGLADRIDPAKQRRRDALREEGAMAEISDGAAGPLNPGDVQDPMVDALTEEYRGDLP